MIFSLVFIISIYFASAIKVRQTATFKSGTFSCYNGEFGSPPAVNLYALNIIRDKEKEINLFVVTFFNDQATFHFATGRKTPEFSYDCELLKEKAGDGLIVASERDIPVEKSGSTVTENSGGLVICDNDRVYFMRSPDRKLVRTVDPCPVYTDIKGYFERGIKLSYAECGWIWWNTVDNEVYSNCSTVKV